MLSFLSNRRSHNCEGSTRRDFLKVGSLGMGALSLPHVLRARAEAEAAGDDVKDTSVIWLWLSGGPTHVETFDPKMTAPSEYRSTTGEVTTSVPGVTVTLPTKLQVEIDEEATADVKLAGLPRDVGPGLAADHIGSRGYP